MGGFTVIRYALPNAGWNCAFYNSLSFHSLKSLSAFLMHVVAIGMILRSLCWEKSKLKATAPLGRNKEAMAFPM